MAFPRVTALSGILSAFQVLQCSSTIEVIREPYSDLGLGWRCAAVRTNVANE